MDIEKAFKAVSRENFLPLGMLDQAARDVPLPIGYGQTNSQPSTVRLMLEWLKVRSGNKVLDVGSGSGWTTALLAHLAGKKGKIIAVERISELVKTGRDNCRRLGIKNVEFNKTLPSTFGWPKDASYDRILVSAAANELPLELVDQLARGGRMVIPVKGSILVIVKDEKNHVHIEEYPGFAFVPLIDD